MCHYEFTSERPLRPAAGRRAGFGALVVVYLLSALLAPFRVAVAEPVFPKTTAEMKSPQVRTERPRAQRCQQTGGLLLLGLREAIASQRPFSVPESSDGGVTRSLHWSSWRRGLHWSSWLRGGADTWVSGRYLEVLTGRGPLRPFLRLSAGHISRPEERRASLYRGLVEDWGYAGAVGGGLAIELARSSVLQLGAAYYRAPDSFEREAFFTLGGGVAFEF
jgi:hypothetical protein